MYYIKHSVVFTLQLNRLISLTILDDHTIKVLYLKCVLFLPTDNNIAIVDEITKRNRIRQVENEAPVAFLATLLDHALSLGANQNIAFENVITNVGDAYNSHAGVFIAPVSGIYVFSTSILSFRSVQSHFAIKLNGNVVTAMFYKGDDTVTYDTTGCTVTLQLSKGDDIAVVNLDSDIDVYGSHYSSFTGFLLQEIYDDTDVVGK